MDKTQTVKEYIAKQIKDVCSTVFYRIATNTAKYPYVIYSLTTKRDVPSYIGFLEINIWDRGSNALQSEHIADLLEQHLDDTYAQSDIFNVTIDLNTRSFIDDNDQSLFHERLLFDLKIFYREW